MWREVCCSTARTQRFRAPTAVARARRRLGFLARPSVLAMGRPLSALARAAAIARTTISAKVASAFWWRAKTIFPARAQALARAPALAMGSTASLRARESRSRAVPRTRVQPTAAITIRTSLATRPTPIATAPRTPSARVGDASRARTIRTARARAPAGTAAPRTLAPTTAVARPLRRYRAAPSTSGVRRTRCAAIRLATAPLTSRARAAAAFRA